MQTTTFRHIGNRHLSGKLSILFLAMPLLLMLAGCDITGRLGEGAQDFNNNWQIGSTVRLAKGTEIREGPSTEYCWHTVVPENGWEVQVIGGPSRDGESREWYDTSRKALGDPSGGTGWILASQANHFPTIPYGGTQCPYSVQGGSDPTSWFTTLLTMLTNWWRSLPIVVQSVVVLVALGLLIWSFLRRASPRQMGLLRAVVFGVILWWVADQARTFWQRSWNSFAGFGGPDPALVLSLVPLVWWAYIQLRWRLPSSLRLLLLVAVVVLGILWLAPQRLREVIQTIQGGS